MNLLQKNLKSKGCFSNYMIINWWNIMNASILKKMADSMTGRIEPMFKEHDIFRERNEKKILAARFFIFMSGPQSHRSMWRPIHCNF